MSSLNETLLVKETFGKQNATILSINLKNA